MGTAVLDCLARIGLTPSTHMSDAFSSNLTGQPCTHDHLFSMSGSVTSPRPLARRLPAQTLPDLVLFDRSPLPLAAQQIATRTAEPRQQSSDHSTSLASGFDAHRPGWRCRRRSKPDAGSFLRRGIPGWSLIAGRQ
jgi:hypothetical protein